MQNTNESVAQAFLPVSAQGGRSSIAGTIGWTVAGVGALVLMGMAINAAGEAMKLPYACWQLTGARAAASTAVIGTLASLRRGHLALFGALYGAWLMTSHASAMLVGSAAAAGVGAWLVGTVLADRGLIVRLLATALTFNVLLTTSGLAKALSSEAGSRTTLTSWSAGVGLRALATIVVVGIFALITMKRSAADERG